MSRLPTVRSACPTNRQLPLIQNLQKDQPQILKSAYFSRALVLIQSLGNTSPTPPLAPISFPFSGNKRQEGQQQVIVFQETKTLPVADKRKAVNSNCQKFSFRVKNLNQEKDIFCSLIHRGHLIGILREILYPITLLSTN